VKSNEMIELLDRHMRAELDANLQGVMDTLTDDAVWGNPRGGGYWLEGKGAIREHYANTLLKGRFDAECIRSWTDDGRQEAVSEYVVTVNLDDGTAVSFPVVAIVQFKDGLMASECLYFDDTRRPADLLPAEMLANAGVHEPA